MTTIPASPACEHCGYSLEGLRLQGRRYRCPECGKRATGRPRAPVWSGRFLVTRVFPTILGACVLSTWWWVAVELEWRGRVAKGAGILAFMALLAWAFVGPLTILDPSRKNRASPRVALGLLMLAWMGNGLVVGICLLVILALSYVVEP